MQAIREILKVKNNKIEIDLPENFESTEVEVIILSYDKEKHSITKNKKIWKDDLLSISTWKENETPVVSSWQINEF